MSDSSRGLAGLTEDKLVQIAQSSGNSDDRRAAAAELLGRFDRAVYLWCYRFVRDHERALDMSQEVLLCAWQALDSFSGRCKFSSWLFVITRNRCLNEMQRVSLIDEGEPDYEGVAAPGPNPARQIEESEDEERMYALIRSTLEPEEQKVLWLRCLDRMPVEEITRVVGIESASGARGVLQRARRKLRAAMTEKDE